MNPIERPKQHFKRTFLTGIFIMMPLLLTAWLVYVVFAQVEKFISPLLLQVVGWFGWQQLLENTWIHFGLSLVSIGLTLLLIYMLGLLGGNVLGRQLLRSVELLVMQVPLVRSIYSVIRQFLDTFSNTGRRAFSRVVLVEYPRKDLWTMAFLTSVTRGEVQETTNDALVSVFVPTTPNPTSGWLLFVPENDVIELTMNVDDAFKMIISGGVLTPPFNPDQKQRSPAGCS